MAMLRIFCCTKTRVTLATPTGIIEGPEWVCEAAQLTRQKALAEALCARLVEAGARG